MFPPFLTLPTKIRINQYSSSHAPPRCRGTSRSLSLSQITRPNGQDHQHSLSRSQTALRGQGLSNQSFLVTAAAGRSRVACSQRFRFTSGKPLNKVMPLDVDVGYVMRVETPFLCLAHTGSRAHRRGVGREPPSSCSSTLFAPRTASIRKVPPRPPTEPEFVEGETLSVAKNYRTGTLNGFTVISMARQSNPWRDSQTNGFTVTSMATQEKMIDYTVKSMATQSNHWLLFLQLTQSWENLQLSP